MDFIQHFYPPPINVLWTGPPNISRSSRFLQETLAYAQITITTAEPGHKLDLGQEAMLHVLTTVRRGAIFLLEWGDFRARLPIGADFDSLEVLEMGNDIGPISALLRAASGFAAFNPPEWIANLSPQLAMLSVEAGNREGLPSLETLDGLEGYNLLRTDRNGWIHISTDGERMWVEVEQDL